MLYNCDVRMMSFVAALVIGMIGAFCFIILQVVLLVDFAHRWNEWWLVVTIAICNDSQLLQSFNNGLTNCLLNKLLN